MKITLSILFAILLLSCIDHPLEPPLPPAAVSEVPENWEQAQAGRYQEKSNYIQSHQAAYDWFGNFAFSEVDGIPYIALKLLPKLAPELWGGEENFLDVVGLFIDERQQSYPIARGIGFSGLSRTEAQGNIDYASFTCGACHIGRVRLENGQIDYLDGGVNMTFNIALFRVKLYQTLQTAYAGETSDNKYQLLTQKLLDALDAVQKNNPHYFYNNFQTGNRNFDADYEAAQIALFKQDAVQTIKQFAQRAEAEYEGFGALIAKNYEGLESEMLAGFPGMADATGLSAINGYVSLRKIPVVKWFASVSLPPQPGITDFMSVWEQDKRRTGWDEGHKRLINGGGQWNGNVPMPIYRNLIAMLTLGLEKTDVRVAAFAEELLDGLPASPYPFNVDIVQAKKGQALFAQHCADCHQPKNGKVYDNLGTSMKRAYVVGTLLNYAARKQLYANCAPDTSIQLAGKDVKPCAEFDGISLEGKKDLLMSPNNEHHGYNARPLSGIWAQAPYLHNGTVPTIYHLLIPEERPTSFIKSRLDYDSQYLGFSWNSEQTVNQNEGYLFQVNVIPALSNKGHDKDIVEGEKTYRLNWSGDKQSAFAIIEYLKTL
ncbi:c-type cytochrome [Nitrosomonas supralitoralis]|uniref:Cytochrome C n=1 Tax=Nitrosomonas supralitoralis TaxID=2116706 RepID=A0A2P7NZ70_9PROT|nr:c-type cytochrome [Nitrosomonas supralitoralis]PSJ18759.1 cytochrome C [Nitrosomonas supralitoralis]